MGAGPKGMFVAAVASGSSAARAKLRPGDIVTAFDDMPVATPRELALAVADHPTGGVVRLRIWHDGRLARIRVRLPLRDWVS